MLDVQNVVSEAPNNVPIKLEVLCFGTVPRCHNDFIFSEFVKGSAMLFYLLSLFL